GFEELGIGIARSWGFPPLIVNSMEKLPAGAVRRPHTAEERLRTLSAYSNDLCHAIATLEAGEREKELARIKARYGDTVPLDDRSMRELIQRSIEEVTDFARIIRINLG